MAAAESACQPQAATGVKLTVVVPTYNEARNIDALVAALEWSLKDVDYEILISDDDSPDGTWARAKEIGKRNTRVRVLRRKGVRGLSAAVIDGFSQAHGKAVACIDGDLQHDPRILPQMLKALDEGAQIVVGSRYVPGGGILNWNWYRSSMSWAATKMAELLIGIRVRDPMSGFFMLRQVDFMRVRSSLNCGGFKILLEIIARLDPASISEVPYVFGPRLAGTSKVSSRVMFAYLRQLWCLALMRRSIAAPTPAQEPQLAAQTQTTAAETTPRAA
jgi:dolichol-phosphate mannosyltransferase